jgi:hypothetical protein
MKAIRFFKTSGTLTLDTAYDTIGDELVMRLAYDTTLPFSSNGNSHNDSNTICSRLADAIRWLSTCVVYLSFVNISSLQSATLRFLECYVSHPTRVIRRSCALAFTIQSCAFGIVVTNGLEKKAVT